VRQVGFTLLSWKLREKDYPRKAVVGSLLGPAGGGQYLVRSSQKTINMCEIAEGISQVS